MKIKGKLYLIPTPLSEGDISNVLPEFNSSVINELVNFIGEDAKTVRRFLKACGYPEISKAEIQLLNEHSEELDYVKLIEPLLKGINVGLMSDAGCPGVADPGAQVVRLAHQNGIEVIPLVGPSSILLSVMASGFNGQQFAFNGYLPIDKIERQKKIRALEQLAYQQKQSQFFIETPYRNLALLSDIKQVLKKQTMLFIGADITGRDQKFYCYTVDKWQKIPEPPIHKIPAVFGIYF